VKINYKDLLNFDDFNVLVIGDVMLDRYLIGNVERQSPEADVPVLLQREMDERLGGAGNVALNIKNLGAKVGLCSVVGVDDPGLEIEKLLKEVGIDSQLLFKSPNRITTSKTRVLNQNNHLLRVDKEDTHSIDDLMTSVIEKAIIEYHSSNPLSLIIIQDYNKGLLTKSLIGFIMNFANTNNITVTVDPKKDNFFAYKNVSLFKPNLKEMFEAFDKKARFNNKELSNLSQKLFKAISPQNLLVTLSEHGSFYKNLECEGIESTQNVANPDVCGAGDAVISLASLLIVKGIKLKTIARITNAGGAQICKAPGVVALDKKFLLADLDKIPTA
jgi:rfaE bifunctional protein kinase chain/domain